MSIDKFGQTRNEMMRRSQGTKTINRKRKEKGFYFLNGREKRPIADILAEINISTLYSRACF